MKKLILDISQQEKNRILEMYGILLNEANPVYNMPSCGSPLSGKELQKCKASYGIGTPNAQSIYDWCSKSLQWVANESDPSLGQGRPYEAINELTRLYTNNTNSFYIDSNENKSIDWDVLLHVCNTACRYTTNPPKETCNVFAKPKSQNQVNKEKAAEGPKPCPAKKQEMTEFINWVDQLVKSGQFNNTWKPFVDAAIKDPCGQVAISGWYSKLPQAPEYPPNSKKFHQYLGSYWWATKEENIRIAQELKKKQDAEKIDKPGRRMTASGAIIPEDPSDYTSQQLKFKNELEKLTPEQRIEYTRLRAKELKDGGFEVNGDLIVDLISTLCEFIPGLGSAASLGIDIIHGIVNIMQGIDSWNSGDGTEGVANMMDGTFGLLTSVVPGAGNIFKIKFSNSLRAFINAAYQTLDTLDSLAGLDTWSKVMWALLKRAGEELGMDNIFGSVSELLNKQIENFKGYDWITSPLQSLLQIISPLGAYATVQVPQNLKLS